MKEDDITYEIHSVSELSHREAAKLSILSDWTCDFPNMPEMGGIPAYSSYANEDRVVIAYDGKKMIGFCTLKEKDYKDYKRRAKKVLDDIPSKADLFVISHLSLIEKFHGKGISKELVRTLLNFIRGFSEDPKVVFFTATADKKFIDSLPSLGFTEGRDELVMIVPEQ